MITSEEKLQFQNALVNAFILRFNIRMKTRFVHVCMVFLIISFFPTRENVKKRVFHQKSWKAFKL